MIGDLVDITRGKFMEAMRLNTCPLRFIAAVLQFDFEGTECSCVRISLNCQHKLELLVRTLASWLRLASSAVGWGVRKSPGRDTVWHISYWIEMLVQGDLGRNNAGSRAGRASALSSGSSWALRKMIEWLKPSGEDAGIEAAGWQFRARINDERSEHSKTNCVKWLEWPNLQWIFARRKSMWKLRKIIAG